MQAFAVLMVAVCLLVLPGVLSAQGNSDNAFQRVKAVQERNTAKLMAKEGVVGTAIGINGQGRYTILMLLDRAGLGSIPLELEGVPVQPVVTGKIYALPKGGKHGSDPKTTSWWPRPVPIGVSTGNKGECSAGTIGCRLVGGYALSCNHVYALEGTAGIGSTIVQPGLYDTKCTYNSVNDLGTLSSFVPITFATTANNVVDAAAANVGTKVGQGTPSDGYGIPKSVPVVATLNMQVQKYGRSSKLTSGQVSGVNATILVQYNSGVAQFINQIMIGPGGFSRAGDSGSLIVTKTLDPVGLLFAGGSGATFANPIGAVLTALGSMMIDGQ